MNKAIKDQLAPGSTFKIIMSWPAQEGVAQDMRVNCVARGTFYGRFFHCDKSTTECWTFTRRFRSPATPSFYALAQEAGHRHDCEYATSLGLGSRPESTCPTKSGHHALHAVGDLKNYHQKYYRATHFSWALAR